MLHSEINLPQAADERLRKLEEARRTALQSMRYSRDEVAMFKRSLELDPDEPEERKARLASAELAVEEHGKRYRDLTDKLSPIYDRAQQIIRNCARKNLELPPLVECEISADPDDPFRWIGVAIGKSEPRKTAHQRRQEYERNPNQRPGEHPLTYAARMKRINGPRPPRIRVEVPIGEQFMAGLESGAAANER